MAGATTRHRQGAAGARRRPGGHRGATRCSATCTPRPAGRRTPSPPISGRSPSIPSTRAPRRPRARLSAGRQVDEARGRVRARAAAEPAQREAAVQLADIDDAARRVRASGAVLEKGLTLDVDRPAFLVKLGEARIELKQLDEAEKALTRGDQAQGRSGDGALQPGAGARGARQRCRRALRRTKPRSRRSPKLYQPQFNLAKLLTQAAARRRRRSPHFRAAVETQPGVRHRLSVPRQGAARRRRPAGGRAGGARGLALDAATARCAPLGHYVLADVYSRHGPRGRRARAQVSAARALQRRTRSGEVSQRASCDRLPGRWVAVSSSALLAPARSRLRQAGPRPRRPGISSSSPSTRCAPTGSAPTATRPSRRRTSTASRAKARWRARRGARAAHAAVARLALHRPVSGRARHPRQRLAAARPATCRCWPRSCSSRASAPPRSSRRSCCRASRAWTAASTHYSDAFDIGDGRRALPEHDPEARRRDDGGGDRVAASGAGAGPALRAGCTSTIRTIPTSRRSRYASQYAGRPYDGEVAWSDELVGRLDAALARRGLRDDTLARRHLRSRRGPRRARRGRARLLRLRDDAARAARAARARGRRRARSSTRVTRTVDLLPTRARPARASAAQTPNGVRPIAGCRRCAATPHGRGADASPSR